ncbi:hypothetical protein N7456_008832 [Penicillium angulare]|uniref:EthD domain-containing protein n=1 Tax=Penicillium angulare TaxID=116970 RepID=A0A9W9K556_9EURO|nr:hypothetical protein N7456_008832 [Penicillium angulare]
MAIRLLLFAYRKPGLSPLQFKTHYEDIHVPLIKSLAGDDFPVLHSRRYLHRGNDLNDNNEYPATVFVGDQDSFKYDAICELVFNSQEAMERFRDKTGTPEAKAALEEDELKFLDRTKLKIVLLGDYIESQ